MKNEKRNTADELFLQDPLLDFDSFFNMEEAAPPKDPLEDLTFAQILKKLPGTENVLQMLELVAHGESEQALVKMRFRGWHELRRLCRALGEMGYLEPVVSLAEAIGRWEGNVEDGFQKAFLQCLAGVFVGGMSVQEMCEGICTVPQALGLEQWDPEKIQALVRPQDQLAMAGWATNYLEVMTPAQREQVLVKYLLPAMVEERPRNAGAIRREATAQCLARHYIKVLGEEKGQGNAP